MRDLFLAVQCPSLFELNFPFAYVFIMYQAISDSASI